MHRSIYLVLLLAIIFVASCDARKKFFKKKLAWKKTLKPKKFARSFHFESKQICKDICSDECVESQMCARQSCEPCEGESDDTLGRCIFRNRCFRSVNSQCGDEREDCKMCVGECIEDLKIYLAQNCSMECGYQYQEEKGYEEYDSETDKEYGSETDEEYGSETDEENDNETEDDDAYIRMRRHNHRRPETPLMRETRHARSPRPGMWRGRNTWKKHHGKHAPRGSFERRQPPNWREKICGDKPMRLNSPECKECRSLFNIQEEEVDESEQRGGEETSVISTTELAQDVEESNSFVTATLQEEVPSDSSFYEQGLGIQEDRGVHIVEKDNLFDI